MIKRVNIIGAGNVATHIAKHLFRKVKICSNYSKDINNAYELANMVDSIGVDDLKNICDNVDLNIIALKDDVIAIFSDLLPKDIPVVHTSGSIKIDVFNGFNDYGILYPLQTCLLYTSPSPRDAHESRMPSSA